MKQGWPRYSKELKFANGMAVHLDATVELSHGRPVIALHDYNGGHDDLLFTIGEAERLGKAWLAAAATAREMKLKAKASSSRAKRSREP
jgi:hypothetical protein